MADPVTKNVESAKRSFGNFVSTGTTVGGYVIKGLGVASVFAIIAATTTAAAPAAGVGGLATLAGSGVQITATKGAAALQTLSHALS